MYVSKKGPGIINRIRITTPSLFISLYKYILCLIIIINSEVWTITHCLGLGHETMVCALCLSILSRIRINVSWTLLQLIQSNAKQQYQLDF